MAEFEILYSREDYVEGGVGDEGELQAVIARHEQDYCIYGIADAGTKELLWLAPAYRRGPPPTPTGSA